MSCLFEELLEDEEDDIFEEYFDEWMIESCLSTDSLNKGSKIDKRKGFKRQNLDHNGNRRRRDNYEESSWWKQ